jgi:hypothetical protein
MSKLFYPKVSKTKNLKKVFDAVNPSATDEDFTEYIHKLLEKSLESLDEKAKETLIKNGIE